jgi:hypothetical protein
LSDHYGVRVTLEAVSQRLPQAGAAVQRVEVSLRGFRCLQTTSGPGSDEVRFTLRCVPAIGPEQKLVTPTFEEVDAGQWHTLDGLSLALGDPGEFLWIAASGTEVDTLSADDSLGQGARCFDRLDLALLAGGSVPFALPPLAGDGGEYVVEVVVTVV